MTIPDFPEMLPLLLGLGIIGVCIYKVYRIMLENPPEIDDD